MLTSAKTIRAKTRDGEVRIVNIRNEEGKLKYNYLLELARNNKLKYDALLKMPLIDLIVNYKEVKKQLRLAYREIDELYEMLEDYEDEIMALEYKLTTKDDDCDDEYDEDKEESESKFKKVLADLRLEMSELH